MKALVASLLFVLIFASSAEARPHRHEAPECMVPAHCGLGASIGQFFTHGAGSLVAAPANRGRRAARRTYGGSIVGHPPGCPRRAFCGCGAAVRVFGTPRRDLWLAAAWLRFPRTSPAPGMVAARRGHVFVLEGHVSGNTWLVYDANSGGRQTRIHHRSLAGYTVVNPRA